MTLSQVEHLLESAWVKLLGEDAPAWPELEEELARRVEEEEVVALVMLLTARETLPDTEEGALVLGRLLGLNGGDERDLPSYRLLQLRLLALTCCNLDCLVYLQSRLNMSQVVREMHVECKVDENTNMVTEASHFYQFIEAQLSQLSREGGSNWPELEPPEQQLVRTDKGRKDANPDAFKALEDHLAVAGLHDLGWVENAGRLYKESRAGQTGGVPWDLVSQLLEGWSKVYKGAPLEIGSNVVRERRREENIGDKLILELGLRLGFLEADKESQNDLNELMCFVENLCGP